MKNFLLMAANSLQSLFIKFQYEYHIEEKWNFSSHKNYILLR